jgi:hypothetical protein
VALAVSGNMPQAIVQLQAAVQLRPAYVDARLKLTLAWLALGKDDAASREWLWLREHLPTDPRVRLLGQRLAHAPSHEHAPADRGVDVAAQAWPEVSLFRPKGAWLGADAAYSVDLGTGRTLWLFGDTFLDPLADGSRTNGPNFFVRNSCAIQSGDPGFAHDPTRAAVTFYWGPSVKGAPSSFFHDEDGGHSWVWPLHGMRLPDGEVLLLRMQVRASKGGLGFTVLGWDAVAVDDASQPPDQWAPRAVAPLTNELKKLVGSSVLRWGEYLYAYAVQNDPQDHSMYLARWPLSSLVGLRAGSLAAPEWWCGAGGFLVAARCPEPAALFTDGQVELSVHYDRALQRFVEVQMNGVFLGDAKTALGVRTAMRPEGPWSAWTPFFRPPEASRPDAQNLAAYAAKAHPQLAGSELLVTYVVNDLKNSTPADTLYYPRAVRLRLSPAPPH